MARSRIVNLANFQQFTAINMLSDPGVVGGKIVIPNCIRVMIAWQMTNAKIGLNVMAGTVSGSFTPTVALCDQIKASLGSGAAWTALAAFFTASTGLSAVRMRDMRSADQPILSSATTLVPGTAGAGGIPDENAVVVTLRTNKVGPQNRGRMYVPITSATAVFTGGVVHATAVTAIQNWANTIPAIFTTAGLTLAIAQPARAAYIGTTGTAHEARVAQTVPVTALLVRNNTWDSQRRRGLK